MHGGKSPFLWNMRHIVHNCMHHLKLKIKYEFECKEHWVFIPMANLRHFLHNKVIYKVISSSKIERIYKS